MVTTIPTGVGLLQAVRRAAAAVLSFLLSATALAGDSAFYESEPNNTPADANAISGEINLYGTMPRGDQDGFLWTVTDDDARKRWDFELHGIPGALTIVEVVRVEYTEDGAEVAGVDRLMKMGSRDGLQPSIHRNQLFEPGEYLIGIAHMGGPSPRGEAAFRPPVGNLSFGQAGNPETSEDNAAAEAFQDPRAYRFAISLGEKLNVSPGPAASETRAAARTVRPGSEFSTFESREKAWYKFEFTDRTAGQRWGSSRRCRARG
jgi:hypothetical protein